LKWWRRVTKANAPIERAVRMLIGKLNRFLQYMMHPHGGPETSSQSWSNYKFIIIKAV
jgi:hypothetical protein